MDQAFSICLVDDDVHVRDGLTRALSQRGFDVVFAPGASAALDVASRRRIDVFVVDYAMPLLGGAQLIPELQNRHPQAATILMSGALDAENLQRVTHELSADACLVKPFRPQDLAALIVQVVKAKAQT